MSNGNSIERYRPAERAHHWFVAISFILLALSGLALFHPAFFFLTHLLGGGPWTRILHPFIGVLLTLSFGWLAVRFWNYNRMTAADRVWLRRVRDVIANRDTGLPEAGRYNAGQKLLFRVVVLTILLLLASGVVIWQPWFTPMFPVGIVRLAVVVHALSAFLAIAAIIVHVYAALWVKGSIRAMTRGTVSRAWAMQHHPGWYREVSKGPK
jgi:formate dehydrogenase subunit gamma